MKTLNEVIKAMEVCMSGESCARVGCPYFEEDCLKHGMELDAIHYLKKYNSILDEYYELKDWWAEEHADIDNEPMTWEDLRMMQDKPVYWMHGEAGEWLTIYRVPTLGNGNDNVIYATTCSGVECWIWKKDLDKFQYYKKERK